MENPDLPLQEQAPQNLQVQGRGCLPWASCCAVAWLVSAILPEVGQFVHLWVLDHICSVPQRRTLFRSSHEVIEAFVTLSLGVMRLGYAAHASETTALKQCALSPAFRRYEAKEATVPCTIAHCSFRKQTPLANLQTSAMQSATELRSCRFASVRACGRCPGWALRSGPHVCLAWRCAGRRPLLDPPLFDSFSCV